MARGGRGGGSSRSSGGGSRGGSRSSGGSRGGYSSSRGGYSGSSRSRSSYSYHPHHHHSHTTHRHVTHVYGGVRSSGSVVVWASVIIFALMVLVWFAGAGFFGPGNITASTIEREKLDGKYVNTTDYFDDRIGWISSSSKLESGMKRFFNETGVQPYLYLTETVNGDANPTDAEMDAFANDLYEELFDDEGHLLVVFQEYDSNGQYFAYYVAGKQAKTVVDDEAMDIFFDYLDHYYYSDLSEEEFFSETFEKTGERMMDKTTSPLVYIVLIVGAVAVVVIGYKWWQKAKKQKNLEAEQTERILKTDIEDLAKDPALTDLENKYK